MQQPLAVALSHYLIYAPAFALTGDRQSLKEKENSLPVGQRNINKGQVNLKK